MTQLGPIACAAAAALAAALGGCAPQAQTRTAMVQPSQSAAATPDRVRSLMAEGEMTEAAAALEAWLADNPGREQDVFLLAQTLVTLGETERALPYAERAFDIAAPVQDKHVDLLAYIYRDLDRAERVEAILRQRPARQPLPLDR